MLGRLGARHLHSAVERHRLADLTAQIARVVLQATGSPCWSDCRTSCAAVGTGTRPAATLPGSRCKMTETASLRWRRHRAAHGRGAGDREQPVLAGEFIVRLTPVGPLPDSEGERRTRWPAISTTTSRAGQRTRMPRSRRERSRRRNCVPCGTRRWPCGTWNVRSRECGSAPFVKPALGCGLLSAAVWFGVREGPVQAKRKHRAGGSRRRNRRGWHRGEWQVAPRRHWWWAPEVGAGSCVCCWGRSVRGAPGARTAPS